MKPISHSRLFMFWAACLLVLLVMVGLLTFYSDLYGYQYKVIEKPAIALTIGLFVAGGLYLCFPWLVRSTEQQAFSKHTFLWLIIIGGLSMRLVFFVSEPAFEDDYQRYLWDGGVTANGFNPYSVTPSQAAKLSPETSKLGALAESSKPLIYRINHPHLRTIYPPVAQGLFAVSYYIQPWSLTAWRFLCLIGDLFTLLLLLLLLKELGRSQLWISLYWLNPLLIKEFFNDAHVEAVLLPFVLGAIWFAIKKSYILSTTILALATGVKLWPALLLPIILRPLLSAPRKLMICVALFAGLCALGAIPLLLAGLDRTSGLVAYAQNWNMNSALFPVLRDMMKAGLEFFAITEITPGLVVRGLIVLILGALVLWLSKTSYRDSNDLIFRCLLVVATLFLLSPAQFPWYYTWVLPFLVFYPYVGFLVLTMTLPLYYLFFYYVVRPPGADFFFTYVVWMIWLPSWLLLVLEFFKPQKFFKLLKQKEAAP